LQGHAPWEDYPLRTAGPDGLVWLTTRGKIALQPPVFSSY